MLECLDLSPRIHGDMLEKETEPWNILENQPEQRERERSRKLIEKQNDITIHYNSITEDVANTN